MHRCAAGSRKEKSAGDRENGNAGGIIFYFIKVGGEEVGILGREMEIVEK